MITKAKIIEYTDYDGDIDGYARFGRTKLNIITDEDWRIIDQMVTKIGLIRRGLTSREFEEVHEADKAMFDSPETYKILQEYEEKSFQAALTNVS